MKRLFKYTLVLLLGLSVWSCQDKMDVDSIFVDPTKPPTDFDNWLYREFVLPYNMEVRYWLDDKEADQTHQLTPASIETSKIMAVLLKHLWLDVYSEASPDGLDFDKRYAVRLFQLVGSGAINSNNTITLGYAEGGKKITLFNLNRFYSSELQPDGTYKFKMRNLDADELLSVDRGGDFHTIHHEFAHILHQTKNYSESFELISDTDYVQESWNEYTKEQALELGFITAYARMNKDEDFVETYSTYITHTQEQWDERISPCPAEAKEKIAQKLTIIRDYIKASWGMDLDVIREIVLRRASEIQDLDYVNLK